MKKSPDKKIINNKVFHHSHALDAIDCISQDIYDIARMCEDGDWTKLDFNPKDKQIECDRDWETINCI